MDQSIRQPWNKGKLVGQKLPLKQRDIWSIRVRLQLATRRRDLALFNLAIDSKLRGCDLVSLRVKDIGDPGRIAARAIVMQQKTPDGHPKLPHLWPGQTPPPEQVADARMLRG